MRNEQQLLANLKAGKQQAVREWFETYQVKLFSFVLTKIDSEHDAEEIVQETFINCLRQINLFRGESTIWTWMQSIARHEIADYYRKKYAKKALRTIPLADFLLQESDKTIDNVSEKVDIILAKMEKYSQELLKQKYVDGKKVVEIAQYFGKSIKAIESELYRARLEFKRLWKIEYTTI